jgi:hypothetical protein
MSNKIFIFSKMHIFNKLQCIRQGLDTDYADPLTLIIGIIMTTTIEGALAV